MEWLTRGTRGCGWRECDVALPSRVSIVRAGLGVGDSSEWRVAGFREEAQRRRLSFPAPLLQSWY